MGGGGAKNTTSTVNQNTSNLPAYAQPFYMGLMNSAQAATDITRPPPVYGQTATLGADGKYTYAAAPAPYDWATSGQRIAGFTPQQLQLQQNILRQQMPGQFQEGTSLASRAGLGALNAANYNPNQFSSQQIDQPNLQQYSMQQPDNVQAGSQSAPQMDAAQTSYNPNLTNYQMQQPRDVQAQRVRAQNMQAAQTDYNPNLNYYQMQGPGSFGSTQAQQFMSPYMQNVVDIQKNEAIRDAQKGQLTQNLGAVRQGTYGGARQLLAQTENQRNLGTQLGNIQAQGQQQAFQNAQQQFNAEQALQQQAGQQNLQANLGVQNLSTETGLRTALANLSNEQQARVNNQALDFQSQGMNAENALRAALANQQMSFNVGQQNLNANLQTQQLGTQTGLQTSLANLSSQQQANVQNQAAQLQQQGLNQQQALQAALANQQAGLTTGQQNLNAALSTQQLGTQTGMQALLANQQTNLEAQRLSEQSNQFGAQQGLAALAQANQSAQTLGNLGGAQQQAQLALNQQQQSVAAQEQALKQQYLDTSYQDYLRQLNYPMEQLQQYSNLLQGVPTGTNQTQTISAPGPSVGAQLMGTGLTALSAYNMAK